MTTATLIPLDRPGRLLKKTRGYLADMEMFISDPAGAITILLDTLPYGDTALIRIVWSGRPSFAFFQGFK